jgi:hypothetical protein
MRIGLSDMRDLLASQPACRCANLRHIRNSFRFCGKL